MSESSNNSVARSIVAAIIGGLIVAVLGFVAIETGLIKAKGTSDTVVKSIPASGRGGGSAGNAPTISEIYKQEGPGVVFIHSTITQSGGSDLFGVPQPKQKGLATGSGFVLDKSGYIATNAHVVDSAKTVTVGFSDSDTTEAKVVGKDVSSDIAIIKVDVDSKKLHPLALGNSDDVEVGQPVIAIGNPLGFDRTVTNGIISAVQREIQAPNGFTIQKAIQTDASINPGNSGGPLMDAYGKVLGINSQIASQSGGSEGIGFAVPVNLLKEELSQLKSGGTVQKAFLGISGIGLDNDIVKQLNLAATQGVLIQKVTPGGPAAKAGLRAGSSKTSVGGIPIVLGGDIITAIDGQQVKDMSTVVTIVNAKKPGDKITVDYLSGKAKKTTTVTLGTRPNTAKQ